MNSIDHLRTLFRYNDWANRRVVAAVRDSDCPGAVRLLAHLLITEKEYHDRMFGKDSTGFDFWPDADTEGLSALAMKNAEDFERLLSRFDDEGLGQRVDYFTSKGIPVHNTFREILDQVLLHSTSHRAQALRELRQAGFEPPSIDYIFYSRGLQ
jgi:uncharacterized damage-inducible protein DinB